MASFWESALGWRRTFEEEGQVCLEPPEGSPEDGIAPDLVFLKAPEGKTAKNRLHLDLRPGADEHGRRQTRTWPGAGARQRRPGRARRHRAALRRLPRRREEPGPDRAWCRRPDAGIHPSRHRPPPDPHRPGQHARHPPAGAADRRRA
ncbi:MAG: VOC family protein, partial [Trebonia sp.]